MGDFNNQHNRIVWADIPVANLQRAASFYRDVLNIEVEISEYQGMKFATLQHDHGNGACLVVDPEAISDTQGFLIYLNVEGRIQEAIEKTKLLGGTVIQDCHAIGPHGYRTIIRDSEGNRVALHATQNH